jgi:hypothetical protein
MEFPGGKTVIFVAITVSNCFPRKYCPIHNKIYQTYEKFYFISFYEHHKKWGNNKSITENKKSYKC